MQGVDAHIRKLQTVTHDPNLFFDSVCMLMTPTQAAHSRPHWLVVFSGRQRGRLYRAEREAPSSEPSNEPLACECET